MPRCRYDRFMWFRRLFQRLFQQANSKEVTSDAQVTPFIGIQGAPVRACLCGAPGIWQRKGSGWDHVPGVCLSTGDERIGQFVGPVCPNCRGKRALPENPQTLWAAKRGWLLG